ncbi:PstS family phosphate ABC transporter substrate-binding protein [Blastococcus saxobsidens]|uniref:Phosphate-binding protein n=1 Tax=Blastococcus saxobsidens (strain DD2) TaxID=1146883 RepID=H6RQH4_BLASD|nr:PstS family phosphate ABC transporter substrate-binding protein [Blastococcus saxobsidens]CCG05342.1 Phosphate transport system substrate-binding protein [Blastococcus saxobsidens DD2]
MKTSTLRRRSVPAAAVLSLALALAACGNTDESGNPTAGSGDEGGGELSGEVVIDGSSTVEPLSAAAAELFQQENPGVQVTVGTSGTGGGFEKFCRGETDISNASRTIAEDEIATCEEAGIEFAELGVANDALSVVVNPENDWADCLTVEELNAIWDEDSTLDNWSQVRDGFPDVPLELFGPGTDSGTFDYFTDAINGNEGVSRSDYGASEDDNVVVQGVEGAAGAMGYFGFSYVEENEGRVKPLAVDGGDGCVEPSTESVQDGSYAPLGRQLFIYPSAQALERPEVQAFVDFYVDNQAEIAEAALFIPLTDEQASEVESKVQELQG